MVRDLEKLRSVLKRYLELFVASLLESMLPLQCHKSHVCHAKHVLSVLLRRDEAKRIFIVCQLFADTMRIEVKRILGMCRNRLAVQVRLCLKFALDIIYSCMFLLFKNIISNLIVPVELI